MLRLILIFSILTSGVAYSQTIHDNFSATEVNNTVLLRWVIVAGETCNGIDVERSEDSIQFNTIHDIEGICGSEDFAVKYQYADPFPKNGKNYYRLKLGTQGYSNVISIEFRRLNDDGYLVMPNPVRNVSSIYFQNERFESHVLSLYGAQGSLVAKMTGSNTYFKVDASALESGVYVFSIQDQYGNDTTKGKLVVER